MEGEMTMDDPIREGAAPDGRPAFTTLQTFLTLPRDNGDELRIERQIGPHGRPIVSLRVWGPSDPKKGHGVNLREDELTPVIEALVRALDRARVAKWERRERRRLDYVARRAARSLEGEETRTTGATG
jgi:hypothetical protein